MQRSHRYWTWSAASVATAAAVGVAWRLLPRQRPIDPATLEYCRVHCGLANHEIVGLIGVVQESDLSRSEALALFYRVCGNNQPEGNLAACEPCVQAILDKALPPSGTNGPASSSEAGRADPSRRRGPAGTGVVA